MTPNPSLPNRPNRPAANSIFFADGVRAALGTLEFIKNRKHLLRVKLGASVSVSSWVSTFTLTVCVILSTSADPEMGWINAIPVVATRTVVKHTQSGGNTDAIGEFPREDVSPDPQRPNLQLAVSVGAFGEFPKPAGVGLFDILPEMRHNILYAYAFVVALSAAEPMLEIASKFLGYLHTACVAISHSAKFYPHNFAAST